MRALATTVAVSLLVTSASLLAYDRLVVKPARTVGIVDLAAVFHDREAEFAALAAAARTDADRLQAVERAQAFGVRLERALADLAAECRCIVLVRSAVAGGTADAVDLTAALEARLEAAP
jgi:hypothetical protein